MDSDQLFNELQKYKRLDKFEKEIITTLTSLTAVGITTVRNTLTDVFKATYQTTFKDLQELTGKVTKDSYDALPALQKNMKAYEVIDQMNMGTVWTKRLQNYSDKDINDILTSIRQGIYKGDSYQSITKDLKGRLDKSYNNTMRVVRTEGKRVQSESQLETFDKFTNSGYEVYKVWQVTDDERLRDTHKSMEGQRVKHGEDFTFPDGSKGAGPAMSSSASESINCRCYLSVETERKKK